MAGGALPCPTGDIAHHALAKALFLDQKPKETGIFSGDTKGSNHLRSDLRHRPKLLSDKTTALSRPSGSTMALSGVRVASGCITGKAD